MATRWRTEFNRADGVSKELTAEMDSGSPDDTKVRRLQRDLDGKVRNLRQLLADIEEDSDEDSTIGRGELQRMRQEFQTLSQLCEDIKSGRRSPKKLKHRDERAALMGGVAASPAYGASRTSAGAAAPAISDREVMQTQERKIDQQDRLLEKLDQGADDLGELAYGISDETDRGMALLDTLERNVDDGHTNLGREQRRADYVTLQTNNCWMYGVLALEIGALVLMLILHKGT